jgi:hypothetical protein
MTDDDVSARAGKEIARAKTIIRDRQNFDLVRGRRHTSGDPRWVLRREREARLKALGAAAPMTSQQLDAILAADEAAAEVARRAEAQAARRGGGIAGSFQSGTSRSGFLRPGSAFSSLEFNFFARMADY